MDLNYCASSASASPRRSSCSPHAPARTIASRGSTPAPTIICPSPSAPRNSSPAYAPCCAAPGHTDTAPPQIIEAGDLRLNPTTREVWRQNELVEVTSIEFDILEVLARSAGRTVTRDELTAVLYQRRATPYERSLDVHISHLRKKLERDERSLIRTIRGVGYQFAP